MRRGAAGMIELVGVTKVYDSGPARVVALCDVDLQVAAGEFVALQGRSGSGKSTLLNLIGGLDVPTAGEVRVDGRALHALSDEELTRFRRDTVGIIFQAYNLLPTLTVEENVMLPAMLRRGRKPDLRAKAQRLLARVALLPRAHHLPHQLSGGEMQRVAIARSLMNDPRVVLADEPTGNLDSQVAGEVLRHLRERTQESGVTVVMVTHSAEVAAAADRVLLIRDGRLAPVPSPTA